MSKKESDEQLIAQLTPEQLKEMPIEELENKHKEVDGRIEEIAETRDKYDGKKYDYFVNIGHGLEDIRDNINELIEMKEVGNYMNASSVVDGLVKNINNEIKNITAIQEEFEVLAKLSSWLVALLKIFTPVL